MKNCFGRIMVVIIIMSMLMSVFCYAAGTPALTSFLDVPKSYWGYDTIMDMTARGIFKGTSDPVDGVGIFMPEKVMTRAEFITVVLRVLYPNDIKNIINDPDCWWMGYYLLALDKELVTYYEFGRGDLSQPMSREEMAMVMVRCVEKMGEQLTNRVDVSEIPDFYTVNVYYRNYVRDCFSFGLLCGIDTNGTFAPKKTLTRAEGATVLCRLIDEDKRIDVEFPDQSDDNIGNTDNTGNQNNNTGNTGNTGNNNTGNTGNTGNNNTGNTGNSNKPEDLKPWEKPGAKQPEDYTWEEYDALTTRQKLAFQDSFESVDAFNAWMDRALNLSSNNPWENGGKNPAYYTWEEYEALTLTQQIAFQDYLGKEGFERWMESVQGTNSANPWETGGKAPSGYTWAEFEALTGEQQIAFQEYLGESGFEAWLNSVNGSSNANPWEMGGKPPYEYSWAEFEALTAEQQIAFQNYLGEQGFETWIEAAQDSNNKNPWEMGGKAPYEYTWAEFEALTAAQQIAFQDYLGEIGFEAWMESAQNSNNKNPWETGGKAPYEYTWAEFEALTAAQQIAFQNYLGEYGFEAWFQENNPDM